MKLLFLPVSIGGGIVAGLVSKKIFEQIWGIFDKEEPPDAKHREVAYGKLLAALAVEGAIFRVARGFVDHTSRRAFASLTGSWPGEKGPEPE